MKRLLATILALLVLACPALGEPARTATLRFSSFAGGGYEYTVEIDDPSIVRCEAKYEYEEQDEPIDGASFDFTATFTGLKPGSTWATVFGKSPIMENEDSIYSITVDDALNVTLSPVRMISTFYLSRMIEGGFASYKINMDSGGYRVSIDEGEERPFSTGAVEELVRVIDTYDITSWDGFSESDYNVLDGESFRLDIGLTDGARVLRWFTPVDEIDLCGHCTFGAAYILFRFFEQAQMEIHFDALKCGHHLVVSREGDTVYLSGHGAFYARGELNVEA